MFLTVIISMPSAEQLRKQKAQIIADLAAAELEEKRVAREAKRAARQAKAAQELADRQVEKAAAEMQKTVERKDREEKMRVLVARKRVVVDSDEDEDASVVDGSDAMSEANTGVAVGVGLRVESGVDLGVGAGVGAGVNAGDTEKRCNACKKRGDPCFWSKVSLAVLLVATMAEIRL